MFTCTCINVMSNVIFTPPPLNILAPPLLVSLVKVLYIFFINEPSSRKMHGHGRIAIRVMIITHIGRNHVFNAIS